MDALDRRREVLGAQVAGAAPRVQYADAEIDRVGAGRQGRVERVAVAGRGQELQRISG